MSLTEKPWGHERLIVVNERYALKDIFIRQGTRSSLQKHNHKLETIYVLSGLIDTEIGDPLVSRRYGPGESYSVTPGTVHRVTALEDTRLIEASTPELDDVVRLTDDYGRAS